MIDEEKDSHGLAQQERRPEFALDLELGRRDDLPGSHPVDVRAQPDQTLPAVLTRLSFDNLLRDETRIVGIGPGGTEQGADEVV